MPTITIEIPEPEFNIGDRVNTWDGPMDNLFWNCEAVIVDVFYEGTYRIMLSQSAGSITDEPWTGKWHFRLKYEYKGDLQQLKELAEHTFVENADNLLLVTKEQN